MRRESKHTTTKNINETQRNTIREERKDEKKLQDSKNSE
jgi:hypothetical protein